MSQTIIGSPSALIRHAGNVHQDLAVIQRSRKLVYINYCCFNQQTIDNFRGLLNCGIQDQWISKSSTNDQSYRIVSAGTSMDVPLICVSCALDSKLLSSNRRGRDDRWGRFVMEEQPREALLYIVVVQGRDASQRSKLVTKTTRAGIASVMYLEALNGFPVVFSCAIFQSDLAEMFPRDRQPRDTFSFKKCQTIAEMNRNGYWNSERIGVLC